MADENETTPPLDDFQNSNDEDINMDVPVSNESQPSLEIGDYVAICDTAYTDLRLIAEETDAVVQLQSGVAAQTEFNDIYAIRTRFCEANTKLAALLQNTASRESLDRNERQRVMFLQLFRTVRNKLLPLLVQSNDEGSQLSKISKATVIKIPKVEIKPFSGALDAWVTFKNLYSSLIHENQEIDDLTKHHYLRSFLIGEAMVLIQNIPLAAETYLSAWQTILKHYDDPFRQIAEHFNALQRCSSMERGSSTTLKSLVLLFRQHMTGLEALFKQHIEMDPLGQCLIFWFLSKCDRHTRTDWEREQSKNKKFRNFPEFIEFMEDRQAAHERASVGIVNNASNAPKNRKRPGNTKAFVATSANAKSKYCAYCRNKDHYIVTCKTFRGIEPSARLTFVKKQRLCVHCLRSDCQPSRCRKYQCRKCSGAHNTLLHVFQETLNKEEKPSGESYINLNLYPNVSSSFYHVGSAFNTMSAMSHMLLATAVVRASCKGHNFGLEARSLLDSGSQLNFVTQNLVDKLKLNVQDSQYSISGIGATHSQSHKSTQLQIQSLHSSFKTTIHCIILEKIVDMLPSHYFSIHKWKIPSQTQLADPAFNVPGNIDLLLGLEIFWDILGQKRIYLGSKLPSLRETKLGWMVTGSMKIAQWADRKHIFVTQQADDNLSKMLERFWVIEDAGKKDLSQEEMDCEQFFKDTVRREASGRFVVRLPFKASSQLLGDSRKQALTRFYSLERRFKNDNALKNSYVDNMRDYLQKGHMKMVKEKAGELSFFLPHFAVIKNTSTSTKVRSVFDASMRTSNGISLNDLLMVGPTLQSDLISIMLRFRTHKYVFVADIVKMYRQIMVDAQDRKFQRIFWRESENQPLQVYELTTVTFGVASAPYLATRCLQALAENSGNEFPAAKPVLLRDFYVDDVLSGADSINSALEIQKQLIAVLRSGGFELSKWCANCPDLLKNIPLSMQETQFPVSNGEEQTIKTLGLLWLPANDCFKIWLHISDVSEMRTKRQILSAIASIFDPMGLLGPVTIKAKHFMQLLWQAKSSSNGTLKWDEVVPSKILSEWVEYASQLHWLNEISIPRCLFLHKGDRIIELHGFSDASEKSYGAVLYLRSLTKNFGSNISLIFAKSKVAPIKKQTIPRLELCGALLLSELVQKIKETFSPSFKIKLTRLWTDSTIVLSWLRAPAIRWQPFVANRVQKIQLATTDCFWDHVDTKSNPADVLSRGISPSELKNCEIWWSGPKFLLECQVEWGTEIKFQQNKTQLPETRKSQAISLLTTVVQNPIFDRYSHYSTLIRVTAFLFRFVKNARPYAPRISGSLKLFEYQAALSTLVKISQQECFSEDIKLLKANKSIKSNSILKSLAPFLDQQGVLRVGGRLRNSELSFEQCHPIVLNNKHKFTKILIRHQHIVHLHAGPQLLKSILRRQYWILKVNSSIQNCILHCVKCVRQKASIRTQMMADLPKSRVVPTKPFSICGLDFAGPIQLVEKRGNRRTILKAYISIFVCFSTKAIHLELVSDLTSQTFIAALSRFISRRGIPSEIHSDNGTTFVGTNSKLLQMNEFLKNNADTISNFALEKGINWHFIPPYSPHFGGLWEAGVKSVKYHLKRVLGEALFNYEQYNTLLIQIEACLNSRPLIPESHDPNDINALTPGHFLIGGPITALPNQDLLEVPENRLKHWEKVVQLQQRFWRRWSSEYLNTLQQRNKWRILKDELKVGDLVILKGNSPPTKWPLGRIEKLIYGSDHKSRVAQVKTANGIEKRAIVKLVLLPNDN